jgi:hypothetical protein
MSELVSMTSSTGGSAFDAVGLLQAQSTYAQSFGGPTTVLLGTLLAFQYANVATFKDAHVNPSSSIQLTAAVRSNLFDELLAFHRNLASAQGDLPEEAARLLRENLWQLYD